MKDFCHLLQEAINAAPTSDMAAKLRAIYDVACTVGSVHSASSGDNGPPPKKPL
jgi:hypothetical protein